MKTPPLPIVGIVLLDLLAAGSAFLVVDQIGMVAASLEFFLFAGLAVGLWQLRKWAWLIEIIVSVLQIAAVLFGIAIAFFLSAKLAEGFPKGEFLAFMTFLIVMNTLIVVVLAIPKIKAEFH